MREALTEREVLLRASRRTSSGRCASCCRTTRACGPAWLIRLGLFLYDHLGGRRAACRGTRALDLRTRSGRRAAEAGASPRGFEYSDCWVDDARLVVLNALRRGRARRRHPHAHAMRRARRATDGVWHLTLSRTGGSARPSPRACSSTPPARGSSDVSARRAPGTTAPRRVRLVKGSHIVVPRLFEHDRAYIFQNADGRIVFAIPYEQRLHADRHHRRGLSRATRRRSRSRRTRSPICAPRSATISRAPVDARRRRLDATPACARCYDDGARQGAGGDARLRAGARRRAGPAPLLSVFGGKITTYRRLAEAAMEQARAAVSRAASAWTAAAALPGGDFAREVPGLFASGWPRSYRLDEAPRLVWCAPTAPSDVKIFADRPDAASDAPGLGFISVRGCTSARLPISSKTNGR